MRIKDLQQSYYDILEINPDASHKELYYAYKRAKNIYSNDSPALYSIFSKEEANELLKLVDEAYEVLNNSAHKPAYDKLLENQKPFSGSFIRLGNTDNHQLPSTHPPSGTKNRPKLGLYSKNQAIDFTLEKNQSTIPTHEKYEKDEAFEQQIANTTEYTGSFLKAVREYKNISLYFISEKSKISKNYLIAIEEENFEVLPKAVFIRGFLVQIAKILDLPPSLSTASFIARMQGVRAAE